MFRKLLSLGATALLAMSALAEDKVVMKVSKSNNNGNAEVTVDVTVTDVGDRYRIDVTVNAKVNNRNGTAHCVGGLLGVTDGGEPKITVLVEKTVGSRPFNNTTEKEESITEFVKKAYYDANVVKERIFAGADYNKGVPTNVKELKDALKDNLKDIADLKNDTDKAFGAIKVFGVKR